MFQGTTIDELIAIVERAEEHATGVPAVLAPPRLELAPARVRERSAAEIALVGVA